MFDLAAAAVTSPSVPTGPTVPHLVEEGDSFPLGIEWTPRGTNFAVWSHHATRVELLLYASAEADEPYQVIELDPDVNRTFSSWHVFVVGLPEGVAYTWRVDGPRGDEERTGYHFDPDKELLDPWARAVSDSRWDREAAKRPGSNRATAMRALVVRTDGYDWEGDVPPRLPSEEMIVYEVHVGGFTRHPSSGVRHPGTFAGLTEKIPYLKALGVTHVELLPIQAFDSQDVPPEVAAQGLVNFWGYSPHSFFAPHPGYAIAPGTVEVVRELRDMVKAMHRAGLRVILDVVFNHTAEGNGDGPIINLKGLGNSTFYHLDAADRRVYRDYTGCGNTVSCNHPVVTRFIIDYLEYWVREMHVDGFRFDLASVLARGEDGEPQHHAPAAYAIELSSVLAHTKLIAEAWDAGGLYQVGTFPGLRWKEWNGRYRDALRRFVRGDAGMVGEVATRLAGSNDLYEASGRHPFSSINFLTCHDGFTLHDLVSYEAKHNEANGSENRDGTDDHLSCNGGMEGPTDDPAIQRWRQRQARSCMALLMLSQGTPMLLYGDEVMRTQHGNNNAYCQDNDLAWLDWGLLESEAAMLRFVQQMIALRKRHPSLMRRRFLTGRPVDARRPSSRGGEAPAEVLPDIAWHGTTLGEPPWHDPEAHVLAFTLASVRQGEPHLHVMINMGKAAASFEVPYLEGVRWYRAVDTAAPSPRDIVAPDQQIPLRPSKDGRSGHGFSGEGQRVAASVRVANHGVLVLEGRMT